MTQKPHKRNVTKKDMKYARDFAHLFGIKIRFSKNTNHSHFWDSIITVGTYGYNKKQRTNLSTFWSAVFHEMCHVLCYREGIFKHYHWYPRPKGLTKKRHHQLLRKTALKAEIYVDKRAEKLMKILLPDIPYRKCYRSKEDQKWYRGWLGKAYPP